MISDESIDRHRKNSISTAEPYPKGSIVLGRSLLDGSTVEPYLAKVVQPHQTNPQKYVVIAEDTHLEHYYKVENFFVTEVISVGDQDDGQP